MALELKVVHVVVIAGNDRFVELVEPLDAESVCFRRAVRGGEADEGVRRRRIDAAHEADLVRALREVALVDADLIGPEEAFGIGKGLRPKVAGYVEGVGQLEIGINFCFASACSTEKRLESHVGEDVESNAIDQDRCGVSRVSGAVRDGRVSAFCKGEGDGGEKIALDRTVVVVEMEPNQAYLLTRRV